MYHGVLNDPKVHRLTIVRRWRWVEILCIASAAKQRGRLPTIDDLAFHMRTNRKEVESVIADLLRVGLLDESPDGKELTVHDWDDHQRPSDDVARRVREWRSQQKPSPDNADVTLQETLPLRDSSARLLRERAGADSDSETEKIKNLPASPQPSPKSPRETPPPELHHPEAITDERRALQAEIDRKRQGGHAADNGVR